MSFSLHTKRRKAIAVFTAFIFSFSGSPLPQIHADEPPQTAPSAAFPVRIDAIRVPEEIGEIKESFQGKDARAVILIQDAHAIPDAQASIRDLIDYFQSVYGVDRVALEGARGELDARIFKSYPDRKALKQVLAAYHDKGELAGATAAAIIDTNGTQFRGVEDWRLFEEGIRLFGLAMKEEPAIRESLNEMADGLGKEKQRVYSTRLYELDSLIESFYRNKGDLLSLLKALADVKKPTEGSEFEILLKEADKKETPLEIEKEVENIYAGLEKTMRAGMMKAENEERARLKQALMNLNASHQDFQTGAMRPETFVLELRERASDFHLSIPLSNAISGVMQRERKLLDIQGTALFEKLERYTEEAKNVLDDSDNVRRLNEQTLRLRLLERLNRLELAHDEWQRIPETLGREDTGIEPERFRYHIAFYKNAQKREETLFRNTETQLHAQTLFVSGGFHSAGMTRLLREAGISYILVTPAIPSLPEDNHYKDQMRGDVSWKDAFREEDGKLSLYRAFVRGTRDRLLESLPEQDRPRMLKAWRDQIIRDLAAENRIEQAGRYTRFIDEVSGAVMLRRVNPVVKKAEEFVNIVLDLQAKGQLNEQNIVHVLAPANIPAERTAPAVLDPQAFETPVSPELLTELDTLGAEAVAALRTVFRSNIRNNIAQMFNFYRSQIEQTKSGAIDNSHYEVERAIADRVRNNFYLDQNTDEDLAAMVEGIAGLIPQSSPLLPWFQTLSTAISSALDRNADFRQAAREFLNQAVESLRRAKPQIDFGTPEEIETSIVAAVDGEIDSVIESGKLGTAGEQFLNLPVGSRTERPVYNLSHRPDLTTEAYITWEAAADYIRQDALEIQEIAAEESRREGRKVTEQEVLRRITDRMKQIVAGAIAAHRIREREKEEYDIKLNYIPVNFSQALFKDGSWLERLYGGRGAGRQLKYFNGKWYMYGPEAVRRAAAQKYPDDYEQRITRTQERYDQLNKFKKTFDGDRYVEFASGFRAGELGTHTLYLFEGKTRTIRLNPISIALAQWGIFYKGAPGDDVISTTKNRYWDQSYPTSPKQFWDRHIRPEYERIPKASEQPNARSDLRDVSRRDFLRLGAAAAAGFLALPFSAEGAQAQDEELYKWLGTLITRPRPGVDDTLKIDNVFTERSDEPWRIRRTQQVRSLEPAEVMKGARVANLLNDAPSGIIEPFSEQDADALIQESKDIGKTLDRLRIPAKVKNNLYRTVRDLENELQIRAAVMAVAEQVITEEKFAFKKTRPDGTPNKLTQKDIRDIVLAARPLLVMVNPDYYLNTGQPEYKFIKGLVKMKLSGLENIPDYSEQLAQYRLPNGVLAGAETQVQLVHLILTQADMDKPLRLTTNEYGEEVPAAYQPAKSYDMKDSGDSGYYRSMWLNGVNGQAALKPKISIGEIVHYFSVRRAAAVSANQIYERLVDRIKVHFRDEKTEDEVRALFTQPAEDGDLGFIADYHGELTQKLSESFKRMRDSRDLQSYVAAARAYSDAANSYVRFMDEVPLIIETAFFKTNPELRALIKGDISLRRKFSASNPKLRAEAIKDDAFAQSTGLPAARSDLRKVIESIEQSIGEDLTANLLDYINAINGQPERRYLLNERDILSSVAVTLEMLQQNLEMDSRVPQRYPGLDVQRIKYEIIRAALSFHDARSVFSMNMGTTPAGISFDPLNRDRLLQLDPFNALQTAIRLVERGDHPVFTLESLWNDEHPNQWPAIFSGGIFFLVREQIESRQDTPDVKVSAEELKSIHDLAYLAVRRIKTSSHYRFEEALANITSPTAAIKKIIADLAAFKEAETREKKPFGEEREANFERRDYLRQNLPVIRDFVRQRREKILESISVREREETLLTFTQELDKLGISAGEVSNMLSKFTWINGQGTYPQRLTADVEQKIKTYFGWEGDERTSQDVLRHKALFDILSTVYYLPNGDARDFYLASALGTIISEQMGGSEFAPSASIPNMVQVWQSGSLSPGYGQISKALWSDTPLANEIDEANRKFVQETQSELREAVFSENLQTYVAVLERIMDRRWTKTNPVNLGESIESVIKDHLDSLDRVDPSTIDWNAAKEAFRSDLRDPRVPRDFGRRYGVQSLGGMPRLQQRPGQNVRIVEDAVVRFGTRFRAGSLTMRVMPMEEQRFRALQAFEAEGGSGLAMAEVLPYQLEIYELREDGSWGFVPVEQVLFNRGSSVFIGRTGYPEDRIIPRAADFEDDYGIRPIDLESETPAKNLQGASAVAIYETDPERDGIFLPQRLFDGSISRFRTTPDSNTRVEDHRDLSPDYVDPDAYERPGHVELRITDNDELLITDRGSRNATLIELSEQDSLASEAAQSMSDITRVSGREEEQSMGTFVLPQGEQRDVSPEAPFIFNPKTPFRIRVSDKDTGDMKFNIALQYRNGSFQIYDDLSQSISMEIFDPEMSQVQGKQLPFSLEIREIFGKNRAVVRFREGVKLNYSPKIVVQMLDDISRSDLRSDDESLEPYDRVFFPETREFKVLTLAFLFSLSTEKSREDIEDAVDLLVTLDGPLVTSRLDDFVEYLGSRGTQAFFEKTRQVLFDGETLRREVLRFARDEKSLENFLTLAVEGGRANGKDYELTAGEVLEAVLDLRRSDLRSNVTGEAKDAAETYVARRGNLTPEEAANLAGTVSDLAFDAYSLRSFLDSFLDNVRNRASQEETAYARAYAQAAARQMEQLVQFILANFEQGSVAGLTPDPEIPSEHYRAAIARVGTLLERLFLAGENGERVAGDILNAVRDANVLATPQNNFRDVSMTDNRALMAVFGFEGRDRGAMDPAVVAVELDGTQYQADPNLGYYDLAYSVLLQFAVAIAGNVLTEDQAALFNRVRAAKLSGETLNEETLRQADEIAIKVMEQLQKWEDLGMVQFNAGGFQIVMEMVQSQLAEEAVRTSA